jgi:hypothetical protein
VLAITVGAPGCGGPAPLTPPPTDTCAATTTGAIDSIEVGAGTPDDLAGHPTPFVPLQNGDGLTLIHGGQGATMLGFILRVSGAFAPSCLGQQTVVTDPSGEHVTSATAPLTTYAEPDGTHVTHAMWLPAAYPPSFVVTVTALGQSLALQLHTQ